MFEWAAGNHPTASYDANYIITGTVILRPYYTNTYRYNTDDLSTEELWVLIPASYSNEHVW